VNIRSVRPDDGQMVVGLLAELGYPDNDVEVVQRRLAEWADEPTGLVLVAETDGRLIGLVAVTTILYLERPGRLGRIVALVVAANARSQGVGRQLVSAAESFARAQGCVSMEVSSARGRVEAHTFYRNLGYVDKCDVGARFVHDLVPGASATTYAARFPVGDSSAP